MQIDRIKISNFKSISELDLNFQEMTGLWEINGVVGAGKTTIGEAIIYGLFGSVRGKTNESLITWGRKHALIELWVYSKAHHIHIRREINSYGQSPLIVSIDGEELLASDKRSVQGILEKEWYDVPRQTLELLCVISFNNFKSLSTLNAQDSRDFLDSTVAFDKIDAYEEYCKERMRECQSRMDEVSRAIQMLHGSLDALETTVPAKPLYESLDVVDIEIRGKEQELTNLKERTSQRLKELYDVWKMTEQKEQDLRAIINQLSASYKKLSGGICPVCGQPITQEHITDMNTEIEQYRKQYAVSKTDTQKALASYTEYKNEVEKLTAELDKGIDTLRIQRGITESYQQYMDTLATKRTKYKEELSAKDQELAQHSATFGQWKEMHDFIKETARPMILGSIIPSVNEYITYYMGLMHQNYVVFFDENFRCMMKNPYGDPLPVTSLSTGQKKIIDVVIILAFIRTFVSQMNFNIFFLDELMSNMDADLRDMLCGMLRTILGDNTVFIISHSPLNTQYFDGIIRVVLASGISQYDIQPLSGQ